jgi:SAM-dependent methyltransferase
VFRDITPARFQQLHDEAFQDDEYLETTTVLAGPEPLSEFWAGLSLPGGSVLEIGPGTGHLLAAARQAGCSVEAVESSKVHRDYIRDTWDIGSLYATMDEIPDDRAYGTIVAVNVFEHIYDIPAFLRAVGKVLAPGGTFFLMTPNARSFEVTLLGTWWPMCKVHDHVSFPSPEGLSAVAAASGLRVERVWSSGLPFELPVSMLTAARDRVRAGRGAERVDVDHGAHGPAAAASGGSLGPAARTALVRFYAAAGPFDPTSRLLSRIGRAACVRARLTR